MQQLQHAYMRLIKMIGDIITIKNDAGLLNVSINWYITNKLEPIKAV
jgi:hypothetical protein